jgi:hypothetical protein
VSVSEYVHRRRPIRDGERFPRATAPAWPSGKHAAEMIAISCISFSISLKGSQPQRIKLAIMLKTSREHAR